MVSADLPTPEKARSERVSLKTTPRSGAGNEKPVLTTTAYDDQLVFPKKLGLRVEHQRSRGLEMSRGSETGRGHTLDMVEERRCGEKD